MRILAFSLLLLPLPVLACTAFTTTHNGRTFIGCNEDPWSINANVRFERGRDGGYGTLYFANYNGHPTRTMADQLGMNEAALVFTHPALVWLPWVLIVLVGALVVLRYREPISRRSLLGNALLHLPVIGLLGYWGMLW